LFIGSLFEIRFPDKIRYGSHNSNVSNFGDAVTKPWIDALFDYAIEVPHVWKQYKHTPHLPRFLDQTMPPKKPRTAACNNSHTSRNRKCTTQNQDMDDIISGNLLALALILQVTKGENTATKAQTIS